MKKIALIVDIHDWAFDNIAKNLKKYLSKDFEIDIYAMEDVNFDVYRMLFALKEYDLVHFFWRRDLLFFIDKQEEFKERLRNLLVLYDDYYETYIGNKVITTSVYDHLFIDKEHEITSKIFNKFKYYTVCNNKLYDIYDSFDDIKYKPTMTITDGVDLEKFKPLNLERFKKKNIDSRELVIGWVGNSEWAKKKENVDFKGVHTILKPVVEELKNEGYKLKLVMADSSVKKIPSEKMPEYYSKIDLYICSSLIEGTPNPVLESMASGIPVISTDVGIVPEVFGEKQQKFILEKRNKKELKKKIKLLYNNRELFEELSKENLESIKNWSWEKKARQFKKFFEIALNGK